MTTNITALAQRLKVAAKNGCCHTLFPDDCLVLVEALEKAQQRITQLEYRAVKLPKRHSMLLREDFNEDYHTEMAFKAEEVQASLDSAGIKVEAE